MRGAACPYGAGTFTTTMGAIAIPPAGTAVYAGNVVCQYLITTGAPIYLRFDSFATEATYDVVMVYDGTSATSALTGSFSGTAIPPIQVATSGSMFISFTSDSTDAARGVSMTWSDTIPAGMTLAPAASPTNAARADPAGA